MNEAQIQHQQKKKCYSVFVLGIRVFAFAIVMRISNKKVDN